MADTVHQVSSQWHIVDNRLAWLMDNDTNQEHRSILIAGIRKDVKELWKHYEQPKVTHTKQVTPKVQATPQSSGFTGNFCDDCGGASMVRSGTCEVCMDCGSTSGCS